MLIILKHIKKTAFNVLKNKNYTAEKRRRKKTGNDTIPHFAHFQWNEKYVH